MSMDLEAIEQALSYYTGTLPEDALRSAVSQRETVTPLLLSSLQKIADNPERFANEDDYILPVFALFLLAEFREHKAYLIVVSIFTTNDEDFIDAFGDFVTEDLQRVLASICTDDLEPIKRVIESPSINQYVRSEFLRSLVNLYFQKKISREYIVEYFLYLFNEGLEKDDNFLWTSLVSCCCDIYPEEFLEKIKNCFDQQLVDLMVIEYEEVLECIDHGKDNVLFEHATAYGGPVSDTVSILQKWAYFGGGVYSFDFEKLRESLHIPIERPTTVRNTTKIGRNNPCICGSGKKYKKCCLNIKVTA